MFGLFIQHAMWVMFLLLVWTLPGKGWALWLAAKRGDKGWFIVLLILNTLAVLEIIYIFAIAKRKDSTDANRQSEQVDDTTTRETIQ